MRPSIRSVRVRLAIPATLTLLPALGRGVTPILRQADLAVLVLGPLGVDQSARFRAWQDGRARNASLALKDAQR